MSNTNIMFQKSFRILTMVGFSILALLILLIPLRPISADVLPVSVSITISNSICLGQSAHLTWSSINAPTPVIDSGIGQVAPYGEQYISPTVTTTYTITGTNSSGGYGTASATVFVSSCSTPTPTPTPTPISYLNISKTVRNISSNSGEMESVNANATDTIEFIIRVSASNFQTTNNIRVTDSLPYGLGYMSGSTTVDNAYWNDGIISGGINLGSFYPGRTATIRFRSAISPGFNNTNTLVNNVSVSADNASTVNDSASVVVIGPIQNQVLGIQKFGKNISQGETTNSTSVNASPNQTIEFDIIVTGPNFGTANNVIVTDQLPTGLTYINNSTSVNGNLVTNNIISSGINIGSLNSNQRVLIKFFATVDTIPAGQSRNMTNTSQIRADNFNTAASNQVNVNVGQGVVLGALDVKTGASLPLYISLLAGLFSTLGFYWYKVRVI